MGVGEHVLWIFAYNEKELFFISKKAKHLTPEYITEWRAKKEAKKVAEEHAKLDSVIGFKSALEAASRAINDNRKKLKEIDSLDMVYTLFDQAEKNKDANALRTLVKFIQSLVANFN